MATLEKNLVLMINWFRRGNNGGHSLLPLIMTIDSSRYFLIHQHGFCVQNIMPVSLISKFSVSSKPIYIFCLIPAVCLFLQAINCCALLSLSFRFLKCVLWHCSFRANLLLWKITPILSFFFIALPVVESAALEVPQYEGAFVYAVW